ncbi:MAG: hypothetical protein KF850_17245 [Labilithrix sp.]|nr:hypothetical protein [Labilithrix sp.]
MNRFSCLLVLVTLPSVAVACSGSPEDEQSSNRSNEIVAGDTDKDKPESARRPGSGGEACGSVTCGEGQVCCNASCGICTAPDMSCIQLACDGEPEPEPKPKPCIKTGCSGQICADQDMASTCEWLPQYACYQSAICERQADGECGFRETKELKECLSESGSASK